MMISGYNLGENARKIDDKIQRSMKDFVVRVCSSILEEMVVCSFG